jgi:hypothetical protein
VARHRPESLRRYRTRQLRTVPCRYWMSKARTKKDAVTLALRYYVDSRNGPLGSDGHFERARDWEQSRTPTASTRWPARGAP